MKICVFLIIYYTCDTRKKVKKGMYIYDLLVVKGTYFNRALNSRTQLNGKEENNKTNGNVCLRTYFKKAPNSFVVGQLIHWRNKCVAIQLKKSEWL